MMKVMIACSLALALLGTLAIDAAAQTSCSAWNSTCVARCKQSGAASCPYCTGQLGTCRKTGCWTLHPSFGGATHCNLKILGPPFAAPGWATSLAGRSSGEGGARNGGPGLACSDPQEERQMMKAIVPCGLALALLGTLTVEVAAQTSCSGWNSRCLKRCKESGAARCHYCAGEMNNCRNSGCWTRPANFGGGTFCSLKKS